MEHTPTDEEREAVGRAVTEAIGARSRRALARRAGVSEGTIRRIEAGWQTVSGQRLPYRPDGRTIVKLAEAVGLDGEELCRQLGRPYPGPMPDLSTADLVADLRRLIGEAAELIDRLEPGGER